MRQTLVRFSTHVIGDSRGPPLPAMRPTGHLKGNQGLDSVGWAGPVLPGQMSVTEEVMTLA